ncbi:glycerate kinase [Anaerococcus vaginalis]|uniref:glycerate kinase n=1 Tax=Anaerococcus vaginalis TaxID=33037 RepID=UPI0028FF375F|nr:glycerate kinase [Anaerococcus vaginalis]MDU1763163.1 glycerate kinase [Anaerococcus vaginalis]MDU5252772.1 glycerate kinase [Anaerococcus vaginalis]MDU6782298.1 glycerate kinase [Anaerococcus vaginalis]
MNILLALDSIKDFENSIEIGNYFKEELESENVNNEVNILPFLDGGMGTVEIMKEVIGGDFSYVNVHNPLSEAVTSRYIIKENLCVMEMAQACGLRLLYKDKLDVMESSSIGLGEMIVDGLNNGCEKFFIGIGDTATNDMGMGMLYALGVRFFDKNLNSLNPVAKNMIKVDSIDMSGLDRRIMDVDLEIATSQPLTLFQRNSFLEKRPIRKGASPDEILQLEKACKHFSKKVSESLGVSEIDFPYLGAGGGVSWALYIFFRAKISNSMELVLSLLDFQKLVRDKDLLIITENVDEFNGENSINLSKFAKRYNENIKIIFLQDEDYPNMRDNPYIDDIYKFKIKSNLERGDYEKEIRSVARTFISDNLSQMENKFEKEELWLREK